MDWKIPLFQPDLGPRELAAVQAPLKDGWITMGPYCAKVEQRLCQLSGCSHTIAVNSCTSALHLSLLAAGIGPGDEVLLPTLTFVATANAVRYLGAIPVFCESVGDGNLNIDVEDALRRVTNRTKAIIPVHYAGYPCDMPAIGQLAADHGLVVVEDCAHSLISVLHGKACGSWGQFGCFSFFTNKNVTCAEGGAITTNDGDAAELLRRLRSHGMTSVTLDRHKGRANSYDVVDLGFNYRLDDIRSSLLLTQLEYLNTALEQRRERESQYRKLLHSSSITVPHFDWPRLAQVDDRVGTHIMPVVLPVGTNREAVMCEMRERRIQTSIHYPPVHQFTNFRGAAELPRTEALAVRQLTLPLYPSMTAGQVEEVCTALTAAIG